MDSYSRETVLLTGLAVALVVLILGAIFYNETPQVVSVNRGVQANLTDQTIQQIKAIIQDENIPLSEKLTLLADYIVAIQQTLNTIQQEINTTEMLTIYKQILNLLFIMLGPTISDKLEKAVVLEDYIIHVVQGVGAGDILAPHLYDWYFSSRQYLEVANFTFNGTATFSSEVKILSNPDWNWLFHLTHPNTWYGAVSATIEFTLYAIFRTRKLDRSENLIGYSNMYSLNYFNHVAFSATPTAMRIYRNATLMREMTISELTTTTSTLYIGNRRITSQGYMSYLMRFFIVYNTSLSEGDLYRQIIRTIHAENLQLFLDPTFFNGTHYMDLSNRRHYIISYDMGRVLANETWIWYIKNATADPGVWLRFFPSGTIIVYRDGSLDRITSTEYYTNRTDIMLIMIPKEAIK
ncbi:MAG: LamG-like jellyroll fold domain-containing protein [Thermosphaera sp.]